MRNLFGIIDLTMRQDGLAELTSRRTLGAVPFGGRYRLIDFTLSNMVNAGIRNVGIVLDDRFGPLLDHVKDGKEWDLDRQRDGMFLLAPPDKSKDAVASSGNVPNLHHNLLYLQKSRQAYALVTASNVVTNIDYKEAYAHHLQTEADITVIYSESSRLANNPPFTCLEFDGDGRLTDVAVNPEECMGTKVFLNMYILSKELLLSLVDYAHARYRLDLFTEAIMPRLDELKIYGYKQEGYVGVVHSLKSYYQHSMELLRPEIWQELFYEHGQVRTKVKHEAPVRYLEGSEVRNSLIATGCTIEGTVENSILFRGVEVGPGVVIRDSIVMQKAKLGAGVILENVILDKDVTIAEGKELAGDPAIPMVIHKSAQL